MRIGGLFVAMALALVPALARAQQAPAAKLNQLERVQVVDGALEISCAQRPNFTSLNLQAPPRLVLDFADTVLAEPAHALAVKAPGLVGVRTESFRSETSAVARVVLTLAPDSDTDISAAPENTLRVKVLPPDSGEVAHHGDPSRLDFAKADAEAKSAAVAKSEADAKAAAEAQARADAEAKARAEAEAKAAAEAKARADAEAQARAAEAKLKQLEAERAQAEAKAAAEAKARADADARAQAERERQEAEAKAAAEAKARADAAEQARLAEEERRKQEEARAAEQARLAQQAIEAQRAKAAAEQAERDRQAAQAKARADAARAERDRKAQEQARRQAETEARAEQEHLAQQRAAERDARLAEARAAEQQKPLPPRGETRVASANPTDHVAVRAGMKDISLVGFHQTGQGGKVFIRANDAVAYTVTETSPTLLVVEVQDARISQRNGVLPLDTSFFSGPVALITPSEDRQDRSVRVEIKLKHRAPYSARLDGNDVVVEFAEP